MPLETTMRYLKGSCWFQALKAANVEFVVAPYEADAQMAHLALTGQVQGVITEDSDLLAYGCPKVSTLGASKPSLHACIPASASAPSVFTCMQKLAVK